MLTPIAAYVTSTARGVTRQLVVGPCDVHGPACTRGREGRVDAGLAVGVGQPPLWDWHVAAAFDGGLTLWALTEADMEGHVICWYASRHDAIADLVTNLLES